MRGTLDNPGDIVGPIQIRRDLGHQSVQVYLTGTLNAGAVEVRTKRPDELDADYAVEASYDTLPVREFVDVSGDLDLQLHASDAFDGTVEGSLGPD